MHMNEEDEAAEALEATGNYKVLRRVPKWTDRPQIEGVRMKVGLMVDVETTGLDTDKDEIIEFCAVPFSYGSDGNLYMVGEPIHVLNQPSIPIPDEIVELTGLTDTVVAGHVLKAEELDGLFGDAHFVIAHHAAFDRKMIERYCTVAASLPWGCSMTQIPWKAEGWNGRALEYLLMKAGYFHNAHQATDDCFAAVHLLSTTLPKSGKTAMAALRETAAKPSYRLYAERAPFEKKDLLKARGYTWSDGTGTKPKAWYIDVDKEKVDAENAYLAEQIYDRDMVIEPKVIDFYSRFSVRE